MPIQRVSYQFATRLPVSRARAFRWATDFQSEDLQLAGLNARRGVEKLASGLILLTDAFDSDPFSATPGVRTVKTKLVHLYPDRWAWTSTHLSGPARHSQFLYQLTARGRNGSTLHFTGRQVEVVARAPSASIMARRIRELKQADSQLWTRFAALLGERRT